MRLIDADELKNEVDTWGCNDYDKYDFLEAINNAPTVEIPNYGDQIVPDVLKGWRYEERPQGEWLEIKHRLNLLIGVLYSNQCISENDLKYIEDSIKKLMKGGAE